MANNIWLSLLYSFVRVGWLVSAPCHICLLCCVNEATARVNFHSSQPDRWVAEADAAIQAHG